MECPHQATVASAGPNLQEIREAAIRSDYAVRQLLMTVVRRAPQQRADGLVVIVYTVAPQRYLAVGRYTSHGNAVPEHRHELLPIHCFRLTNSALRPVSLEAALDR